MISEGKNALATASGVSLYKTIAIAFAREGAHVVVSDIRPDLSAETEKAIRDAGSEAKSTPCDVANEEAVQAWLIRPKKR